MHSFWETFKLEFDSQPLGEAWKYCAISTVHNYQQTYKLKLQQDNR